MENTDTRTYILEADYPEINVDMDGVLTNFRKAFLDKTGKNIETTEDFWKYIEGDEGFWEHMEWLPEGKKLWNKIKHFNPTILSSPTRDPLSKSGKSKWVDKHLGKDVPRIFDSKKWKYAGKDKILIDDYEEKNIKPWIEHGGIGIVFDGRKPFGPQVKQLVGINEDIEHINYSDSSVEFTFKENGEELGTAYAEKFNHKFLSPEEFEEVESDGRVDIKADHKIFWLSDVSVPIEYRGNGIATSLIHSVEEFARHHGYNYLMLRAQPSGKQRMPLRALVHFYEKRGFSTIADLDPNRSVIMVKEI